MAIDSDLSEKKLTANRKNAQYSTGPHTEAGKAISARNALTLGLFTKTDYIRPAERSAYNELCARYVTELNPEGVLEETLVTTIVSATWLLRRCATVERELIRTGKLDPLRDAYSRDTQSSINRARSHASLLLRRSTAELRRLQTDRVLAKKLLSDDDQFPALASAKQIVTAIDQHRRAGAKRGQDLSPRSPSAHQNQWSLASNCTNEHQIPRSARCPCGSGEKFKRCCGKDAPPVLNPSSNPESSSQERKVA